MILAEIILAGFIIFGLGAYAGKEQAKKVKVEQLEKPGNAPDIWPPNKHKDLLKQCAIACGEDKMASYNSIYGKCICKE